MLTIVPAPNPILNRTLEPVGKVDSKIIKIIKDMELVLINQKDPPGVGLAANQVDLDLRIFLALIDNQIVPFINPEILDKSTELYPPDDGKNHLLEGCLSLHGYYGLVRRSKWIKFKAVTVNLKDLENGIPTDPNLYKEHIQKYTNFPAQIIQHEMDHLNGHIFVERILEQKQKLYKITGKDKKDKTVFEEVDLA